MQQNISIKKNSRIFFCFIKKVFSWIFFLQRTLILISSKTYQQLIPLGLIIGVFLWFLFFTQLPSVPLINPKTKTDITLREKIGTKFRNDLKQRYSVRLINRMLLLAGQKIREKKTDNKISLNCLLINNLWAEVKKAPRGQIVLLKRFFATLDGGNNEPDSYSN